MLYIRFLLLLSVLLGSIGSLAGEIHDLAREGRWAEVFEMLYAGADVNQRDDDGRTLLDIATKTQNDEIIFEILRIGGGNGINDSTLNSQTSIQALPQEEVLRGEPVDEAGELNESGEWPMSMETPAGAAQPSPMQILQEDLENVALDLSSQFDQASISVILK